MARPVDPRPRLRPLETFPVRKGQDVALGVRDPEGLAEGVLVASPALALLLSFFDGRRDAADLAAAWTKATGEPIAVADVERVIADLDRNLLLESPRADAARASRLAAYRALARRPAVHAGQSYPEEPDACAQFLHAHVASAGTSPLPSAVTALLAPHIDLRGGGACHGAAARAIARSPATTFVILGTAHAALRRAFALTTLPFDTPFGPVDTDADLVARLARRGGASLAPPASLFDDELAHASEHSVEFQALWVRRLRAGADVRIVPVLAGSLHRHVRDGTSPMEEPAVADFVGALREVVEERGDSVSLVASIDLAHVGPRYGDEAAPDPLALERVREADAELLSAATAVDGERWIRSLHAIGDRHHVCGTAAAYVLLKAIEGRGLSSRLLRHDRWEIDPDSGSHVSFAAVAYGTGPLTGEPAG